MKTHLPPDLSWKVSFVDISKISFWDFQITLKIGEEEGEKFKEELSNPLEITDNLKKNFIHIIVHFHLFFSLLLKISLYLSFRDLLKYVSCPGLERRDLMMQNGWWFDVNQQQHLLIPIS